MLRLIHLIFFSLFSLFSTNCFAQKMSALQVYDQVAAITAKNFYDPTLRGLNWKELTAQYRRTLSSESSTSELSSVLNHLLQNLRASHTEFVTFDQQEYHGLESIFSRRIDGDQIYQCGGWYQQIDGKWFIRNVFPGSPMAKGGLRTGDEIVSVDQKPFTEVSSCNTVRPVQFKIRRNKSKAEQVFTLRPTLKSVQEILLRATIDSEVIWNLNGQRIGYFHLWSGTDDLFLESLQNTVLRFAKTTDLMILDLRDGFGGAWTPYLQPFFATDLESGAPVPQIYSKPMYVLINEGVRSGKEYLALVLKEKHRALLIGTNTAGHVLGGKLFPIEAGTSALYLAVSGDPTGVLEGKGVAPDIRVEAPIPYRRGTDPQLQKVLELIKSLHKY